MLLVQDLPWNLIGLEIATPLFGTIIVTSCFCMVLPKKNKVKAILILLKEEVTRTRKQARPAETQGA